MQLLLNNLTRAGKPPVPLAFPDGTRLLVLPFGGRLLGLFPPGSDENFLWTNPELATPEAATAWLSRESWPNSGGDRTWLAPEIELFIGDMARPWETYVVPPALDPGCWTLTSSTGTELCMTNETRLRLNRADQEIRVHLEKRFLPAENPLQSSSLADAGLEYAGFMQVTTLETEAAPDSANHLGIWNLLQLPQPGVMLIPTRSEAQPRLVFGELSDGELFAEPHRVRWEMSTPGTNTKIAIKPHLLTGRAGYLRKHPSAGTADLVVREFAVDPDGTYVDALWEQPHETGWAFQACCVREGKERFNELEYHASASTKIAGRICDESRLWAFRGNADAITQAAEILLGPTAQSSST